MGFRCPGCHKDFGIDKDAMIEHSKTCLDGLSHDVVETIVKLCDGQRTEGQE